MLVQKWIVLTLVLIIFATIVQIAGLVSPLWIYLEKENNTIGVGLYYRIGCDAQSGNNCSLQAFNELPFGYNTTATYNQPSWKAIQSLETISAAFGFILSILMVVYFVGFGVWKKMNSLHVAMVIIAILAWLPLSVGLIIYIIFNIKVITRSPETSPQSFPWSPVMCLFAGILFFIITFLIRIRCRNRNYVKNAIPTSTDSKIALNPSTKNALMKRYFTPSPYREERRQALYSSDKSHLLGNGSVLGAIENNGVDNTGSNHYTRAIEYNVTEDRQDVPMTRVIQTNNISAGVFAGAGIGPAPIASNNDYRETIYGRDLSSLVNNSTTRNYGTEVVERTYTTRIVGENGYGNHLERANIPNYQSESVDVNRKNYYQMQWGDEAAPEVDNFPEMNIVGNRTTLNRGQAYDTFSEIDAETVYYTGKEGFRPITLNRTDLYNSDYSRSNVAREVPVNGYVHSREARHTLQPVQEEQNVAEVTIIDRAPPRLEEPQSKPFRIPADHNVVTGKQKSADYTVHTRTITEPQTNPQLILAPGVLSGRRSQYNGKYIYRPYSESSY